MNKVNDMNEFHNQVEEQMEKFKKQIESEVVYLVELMQKLDINSEEKLDDMLECATLFNKLRDEKIITKISDCYKE